VVTSVIINILERSVVLNRNARSTWHTSSHVHRSKTVNTTTSTWTVCMLEHRLTPPSATFKLSRPTSPSSHATHSPHPHRPHRKQVYTVYRGGPSVRCVSLVGLWRLVHTGCTALRCSKTVCCRPKYDDCYKSVIVVIQPCFEYQVCCFKPCGNWGRVVIFPQTDFYPVAPKPLLWLLLNMCRGLWAKKCRRKI